MAERLLNKRPFVVGVGINDANYTLRVTENLPRCNGKQIQKVVWECPYYVKWKDMLTRCYSKREHKRNPNYSSCIVEDSWLTFSIFKSWMEKQDWQGKDLDKDLLIPSNKVYSPNTCTMIPRKVNTFIGDCYRARGDYLLGCHWDKKDKKFRSQCRDTFVAGRRVTKYFDTELEVHFSWKKQKHVFACKLANSEYVTDERARQALLHRYENYNIVEDWCS